MNSENCDSKIKLLIRRVGTLSKKVDILTRIITANNNQHYPWYRLPAVRMKAVEAVLSCMTEHPSYTIRQAAAKVFVQTAGGYPNWKALASYCYGAKLPTYIRRNIP